MGRPDEAQARLHRSRAGEDGGRLSRNGVETLHGPARFTSERQVDVDGTRYDSDRLLIATGATPRPLDFPGHEHLIDSTGFLDLGDLPSRILFVGGGFVSFEFAHIAARAGASPVIVDRGERPLKGFDRDLVELLVARGAEIGVELRRSTEIAAVEPNGRGYIVTLDRAGVREIIETELVVHGAGRVADLSGLALDAAGGGMGPAWPERLGPPLEHHESGRVGCRGHRGHRGDAADAGGGHRGQGCRLQHTQGHHDRPQLPASRRRCSPSPSSPASACSKQKPATEAST